MLLTESLANAERSFLSVRHSLYFFACGLALCFVGCAGSQAPQLHASDAQAYEDNERFNEQLALMAAQADAHDDYRMGPEDLVAVTLFDIEDKTGEPRVAEARISSRGFITLPHIGKTHVSGRTPGELEDHLRERYQRYIHSPQLTVLIKEYRSYRVSVVGYVKEPGVLDLRGKKTLVEAVALSGGLNDEAGKSVRVTRQGEDGVQTVLVDLDRIAKEGDISLNLMLLPGDVISVPKAGTFYVEGLVAKPGAYPLLQETTVSQAVATAGGANRALADVRDAVLYRKGTAGERIAMPINLARLQSGKLEDFLVREDDVIVVPLSGAKFFWDRVTGGILRVGFNGAL